MPEPRDLWNEISPMKCSKAPVPVQRKALNQDKDSSSFPFMQLISNLKNFQRTEIWTEAYLAFRVYCLNFNQHRQTVHFRKFSRLIQILKRFQAMDIETYTQQLIDQFQCPPENSKKAQWTHLPDKESTRHALLKFTGVFHLSALCIKACEEVHGFDFMHTSAVMLGMASRVKLIAQLWKDSAKTSVHLLRNMNDLYKEPMDIPSSWGVLEPEKHVIARKRMAIEDYKAPTAYATKSKSAKSKKRCLRQRGQASESNH